MIDLSATLERSLILIDDQEDQLATATATSKKEIFMEKSEIAINFESKQQGIYKFYKTIKKEQIKEEVKIVVEDQKEREDSPLPLWRRLGMRKENQM